MFPYKHLPALPRTVALRVERGGTPDVGAGDGCTILWSCRPKPDWRGLPPLRVSLMSWQTERQKSIASPPGAAMDTHACSQRQNHSDVGGSMPQPSVGVNGTEGEYKCRHHAGPLP